LGPPNGWTWGNNTTEVRSYNTDENLAQVNGPESHAYTYDNALRIQKITNSSNSALSYTYGYDLLDRLNSAAATSTTQGFTYDANGNRLTETGTVAGTYTPSTTSNRLSKITGSPARTYSYDAAGNTLSYGSDTFTYYNDGRMKTVKAGSSTTTYIYNALGQRIEKTGGPAGSVVLFYDEAGHILGEYTSTGALVQETVWMGDIPVATIRPGSPVLVYYVHADHLNAPRMVTQPSSNKIAWRWDTDPFGTAAPNQNPAGLGTFSYNLRYPGQYYDSETGLNQNMARDYDPQVGRYIESDPTGLSAGVNTYEYVRNNPVSLFDRYGLLPGDCYLTENAAGANAVNDINWQSIQTNTEYAGSVYQNADGTYSYTAPDPGLEASVPPPPLPSNGVGRYHTHGGQDPAYYGENFSPADVSISIDEGLFIPGYVSYLGTPDGVIKAFDPHSYIDDPQTAQFWNLPYPVPGQSVPCSCGKK
jgi:RHS repeat-associated protein